MKNRDFRETFWKTLHFHRNGKSGRLKFDIFTKKGCKCKKSGKTLFFMRKKRYNKTEHTIFSTKTVFAEN